MRKALIVIVVVAAVVFCVKKYHIGSYAGTVWCQMSQEVKDQLPTKLEIDRVRHEIGNLEGDIGNMIKPIAEHMAVIGRMRKEITAAETKLAEQRTAMLNLTKALDGNPAFVTIENQRYSAERIRQKLQRDIESYKRFEAHIKGQNQLLEAKEASLQGAQDQLAKVVSKKREYELRLAQLEADEEMLQVSRIGSKLQIDNSRATQIEAALAQIEHRHEVQRKEIELRTGQSAKDAVPVPRTLPAPIANVETAVRQYLENGAATSTEKP